MKTRTPSPLLAGSMRALTGASALTLIIGLAWELGRRRSAAPVADAGITCV